VLYWRVSDGKRMARKSFANMTWSRSRNPIIVSELSRLLLTQELFTFDRHNWSTVLGYPVQGLFGGGGDGTDVNTAARSSIALLSSSSSFSSSGVTAKSSRCW
jgi:hypothetical protein